MDIVTLPELFRRSGYNTTGAGKVGSAHTSRVTSRVTSPVTRPLPSHSMRATQIYHPGTPSGGMIKSEGGGDQCPAQSKLAECARRPALDEPASWTEPYFFCDQYTNDTVQSPAMQQWECALHGEARRDGAVARWPSCGGGCVQNESCVQCFEECGTWGKQGAYAACACPDACYPEGVIAEQTIRVLRDKAAHPGARWFHAVGFKRPHLSYRAPQRFFDMYDVEQVALPVHRTPSPTAPAISYAHTCIGSAGPASGADPLGMAAAVYPDAAAAAGACSPSVVNRTSAFNGTYASYIEIIRNDTTVRELRRAYYATISFTDAALGRVLDELARLSLDASTVVTFLGDHGYQNGQKGEWCKSTLTELATRVPMYVVPPRGAAGWARGRRVKTPVEAVDLLPTLAELAGLRLPTQAYAGESLRPLLQSTPPGAPGGRNKTWALTQWPRRPSCTTAHHCLDGGGDPYDATPDQAVMGYRLRTDVWAYVCWVEFDWGTGGDPRGSATLPKWDRVLARELYTHEGDDGSEDAGERFEWENLADDPAHREVLDALHTQLKAAVASGSLKPLLNE